MLYRDPLSALLRVSPLQQLFREHLLAQSALNRGDWVEAAFVLIAPRANDHAQRAGQLYAAHLNEPADTHVKFAMVDVEGWIGALGAAGEDDYALALFRRYCDWQAIDRVIDETLGDPPGGSPHWQPCPNMLPLKPKITPVMLAA
jgi:hypothetical protein